jgi:hypothetical protein
MGRLLRRKILIVGLVALAFALIGASVGLIVTSGGGASGSARNLTLQPSDLPPDFVFTEEKLYSREELLAKLSADAQEGREWLGEMWGEMYFDHQATEEGLTEAVHLTYESGEDTQVVDVWVYTYEDEDATEAAHAFARASDEERIGLLKLGNGMRGYMMPIPSALVPEGMGDDACYMFGSVEYDDGDENAPPDPLEVLIYFMYSGSARAEVRLAGYSEGDEVADGVARNQYLRLERPAAVVAP